MATWDDARAWAKAAPGRAMNPDGAYKLQCVDVIDDFSVAMWGNWAETIRPGNANELPLHANPANWEWIPNVVGDLSNFPRFGDWPVFGGDAYNGAGHVCMAVAADAYSMTVLQQNADGTASVPCSFGVLGYDQPGTGPCWGWYRPLLDGVQAATVDLTPADAPPAAGTLRVADLSEAQTPFAFVPAGVQAVIVKLTEGVGPGPYTHDSHAAGHVANAREAGIPVAFYHYAHPDEMDGNTAQAEAAWFLLNAKALFRPGDRVYLDWEAEQARLDNGLWAAEWLTEVATELACPAGLYGNLFMFRSLDPQLQAVKDAGFRKVWVAQYPAPAVQTWGPVNRQPLLPDGWEVEAWQYTDKGRLPGCPENVDLNVFNGTAAAWTAGTSNPQYVPVIPTPAPATNQIIVEADDTMTSIAAQFHVSLADLEAANPIADPDLIYPGQVLYLPGGAANAAPVAQAPAGITQCVVEQGDTLSGIAAQFGVSLQELIRVNGIVNANLIYPGQVLTLPGGSLPPAPAPVPPGTVVTECVVEGGDTLSSIAEQFGTTVDALVALNGIADPDRIYPGQVLRLR